MYPRFPGNRWRHGLRHTLGVVVDSFELVDHGYPNNLECDMGYRDPDSLAGYTYDERVVRVHSRLPLTHCGHHQLHTARGVTF